MKLPNTLDQIADAVEQIAALTDTLPHEIIAALTGVAWDEQDEGDIIFSLGMRRVCPPED